MSFREEQVLATRHSASGSEEKGGIRRALLVRRYAWVTWILAFFLLGYVGAEVAIGGWVVTFLMRVRDGAEFASGMGSTGYWLGITLGRVVLGFVTPWVGEKLAIAVLSLTITITTAIAKLSKSNADLPHPLHRILPRLLARPKLLRLHHHGLLPGLLPRPHVPRRRRRGYPSPPALSARQRDWLRCCVRGERRGCLAICCGCCCADEGRGSSPAVWDWVERGDFGALVWTAADAEGGFLAIT